MKSFDSNMFSIRRCCNWGISTMVGLLMKKWITPLANRMIVSFPEMTILSAERESGREISGKCTKGFWTLLDRTLQSKLARSICPRIKRKNSCKKDPFLNSTTSKLEAYEGCLSVCLYSLSSPFSLPLFLFLPLPLLSLFLPLPLLSQIPPHILPERIKMTFIGFSHKM